MSLTFTTAITRIADTLNRTDVNVQIMHAVNTAIRKIERKYNFNYMQKRVSVTLTPGTTSFPYPAGFKQFIKVVPISGTDRLRPVAFHSEDIAMWAYPGPNDTGEPDMGSLIPDSQTVLIRPKADKEYSLECRYFAFSDPLILGESESHWLLTNFEEVVVYGALIEMVPVIKDFDRDTLWRGRYKEACKILNDQEASQDLGPKSAIVDGAYRA
jgi:hypothetical protein